MGYISITPFRRAHSAARVQQTPHPLPQITIDKWNALREITTARQAFGLGDRDIAVLQALFSFHPETRLDASASAPVVFPSNKAICERLGGMACSTMRRHLACLVKSGLITRRDSPNGKRYCRRAGTQRIAFGFDLSPIIARFGDITQAAEAVRAIETQCRELRETISLMKRDLMAIAQDGLDENPDAHDWQSLLDLCALTGRALRRKLDPVDLERIAQTLSTELERIAPTVTAAETEEMSTNVVRNEQHQQRYTKDFKESELTAEKKKNSNNGQRNTCNDSNTDIPMQDVLKACPEIQTYCEEPVKDWRSLIRLAHIIHPMLGISSSLWARSLHILGPVQSSIVIAAMLERFSEIRSPGAYLQNLLTRAQNGVFTARPMVQALLNARLT